MGRKIKYNTEEERQNAKKQSVKDWYNRNKEILKKKRMRRYEYNKELQKKCNRKYYLKNREKIIKRCIEWGQENREKIHSYRNKWKKIHSLRKLSIRANKHHEDKITSGDLWKIVKKQKLKCALTGDKLTRENISLDHIIPSSKGGKNIFSNLRLVTIESNFLKNTHTDEKLLELCKKVVNYLSIK